MSLIEKSGQQVGSNSQALQVGGNLTVGNTTSEVISICELVVSTQMAAFKKEAFELAESRARDFGQQIANSLSEEINDTIIEKLRDPDIQYSINQAVVQVARKGFDAKSDLLKELIVSKMKNDSEELDFIIDQALEATSKLSTNEIKFMAFIYYFRFCIKIIQDVNVTYLVDSNENHPTNKLLTLEFCRSHHKSIYTIYDIDLKRFLGEIQHLKKINIFMLSIKGCLISMQSYQKSYFEIFEDRTGITLSNDEDNFKKHMPVVWDILQRFGVDSLAEFNSMPLTPIGESIANNYLKAHQFI